MGKILRESESLLCPGARKAGNWKSRAQVWLEAAPGWQEKILHVLREQLRARIRWDVPG